MALWDWLQSLNLLGIAVVLAHKNLGYYNAPNICTMYVCLQVRHLVVAVDDSDEGCAAVAWVLQNMWREGELALMQPKCST